MKPFNLQAALAGAQVITRAGGQVLGLHLFEVPGGEIEPIEPLLGAVGGAWQSWPTTGRYLSGQDSPYDLFMAPVKHKGWVAMRPSWLQGCVALETSSGFKTLDDCKAQYHESAGWQYARLEYEE